MIYNCISANTLFPYECLDFMLYLNSADVQRNFARAGRITADREANRHLRIPRLSERSHNNLCDIIDNGKVIHADLSFIEFVNLTGRREMFNWQNGQVDVDEFIELYKRKARHFRNGKSRRGKNAIGRHESQEDLVLIKE